MKLKTFFTIIGWGIVLPLHAQHGIGLNADRTGRIDPHPAAVVEIQSSDKGVLIPRLTEEDRLGMKIDSTADGLLLYQKDKNIGFYLVQNGEWVFLNPILLPDGSEGELTFAQVAYSGDYYDLKNRPNLPTPPESDTTTLAKVALSGDYNDLKNRPTIPERIEDIAQVAYTGNYADLTIQPRIVTRLRDLKQDSLHRTVTAEEMERWNAGAARTVPTHLQDFATDAVHQTLSDDEYRIWDEAAKRKIPTRLADLQSDEYAQTVTDNDIALWDSAANRNIPTSLRDLAQDSLHRTITETQRERWNTHAGMNIPTALADYRTDDYYTSVTYAERRDWDRQANKPIPTRLADLQSDEYAQTVTDTDIRRWEAAAKRKIPMMLRDLKQDSAHRTVTTQQLNRWTTHADAMFFSGNYADLADLPEIPRHLSQFTDDELHKIISYKEREAWDSAYRRKVPTALADLIDDNMDYRLVSDREKQRWDSMVTRDIPQYEDNEENAFILHGNPEYMENYRPLSAFGRQGTWSSLQGRPTFSPNTAPVTGNYADLDAQTLPNLQAVASGFLQSLSYNDLLYDKPELEKDFVKSGKSQYIAAKPEMLSDFLAAEAATHVSSNDVRNYRAAYDKLLQSGLRINEYSTNNVYGTYSDLRLSDKLELEGIPTVTGTFPSGTVSQSTAYDNYIPTIQLAKDLDALAIEKVKNTLEEIPEGVVMMWPGNDFPTGKDVHGGCWKKFNALEGKFPVGAKISDKGIYTLGETGGTTEVTLTIDQMPKHGHKIVLGESRSVVNDKEDFRDGLSEGQTTDHHAIFEYEEKDFISYNSTGRTEEDAYTYPNETQDPESMQPYPTRPHNNLPPYYVINFIIYTKSGCPAH